MTEQRQDADRLIGWARLRPAGTKSHYYDQGRRACAPNAPKRDALVWPEPNHNLDLCARCLNILRR